MKSSVLKNSVFANVTRLAKDCAGNVTIITGLAAIPLVAAAGLAIDYSRGTRVESELQQIADSAALAAAAAQNVSGTTAEKRAQRTAIAENYLDTSLASITDTDIVGSPAITAGAHTIEVAISAKVNGSLINVLNAEGEIGKTMTVSVNSKAAYGKDSLCLLSLEPDDTKALQVNSDASITAPGCAIHVNSSDSEALYANSGSIVTSEATCIVGDYATNGGSSVTPTPETGCATVADPLASVPVPDEASNPCDYNDIVVQSGQTRSYAPGVFCGKLEIQNNATVTFEPGIHVMRDAEFVVNSGGHVIGQDVMIYLRDTKSRLNLNSGSTMDLRAPRTGTYAGIAVFQDRNVVTAPHIVNSDSDSRIEGVVYVPNNELHINSGSSIGLNSPWWAVIARKFDVNSASEIHFNVDYAVSSVPMPLALGGGRVRLID